MRSVSFSAGETGSCEAYIAILGGDGGGLEMNVNRWLGQFGAAHLDADGISKLDTVDFLGQRSPIVEAVGDYADMAGNRFDDYKLLAALCIRSEGSVFAKMIGPVAEVEAERDSFLTWVNSLENAR